MSATALTATFDGNSLTAINPAISILGFNQYRTPQRKLSSYQVARRDAQRTNSAFYSQRNISVRVNINDQTRDQVERGLDQLMSFLQGINKELVLTQSGGVRKYYCTLSAVNFLGEGGAYLELELVFACDDFFGYDTAYTTVLGPLTFSSSTRGDQLTFGGSAPWQQPLIVITYSAISGGTSKSVVIGNSATGQAVTVTRTFIAGDRLEIDVPNGTVKVNGVEVAFTGALPEWQPKLGNWSYSDNFTSRTATATITNYKRYI